MAGEGRSILHVTERTRGGVATHVAELMRRQRASGRYERVMLLADPRYLDRSLGDAADGVLTYRSGRRPDRAVRAARAVERAIRRTRPAAVHLHSSFPGLYGRMFSDVGPDAPAVIYCPHGWAFEMEAPAPKQRAYAWFERALAAKADAILSISDHERRAAEAIGLDHAGHVSVPHGAPPAAPTGAVALPRHLTNLLFVGRFDRQKGLDLLLETFARTDRPDLRLHIIGAPDQGGSPRLDISDRRIALHGWVPHDRLDDWYAAADAVVMPSRWEGFGLVAIEAMRNGTPVLASDRGALPEVLGGSGMLFEPEDAGGLAALLEGLDKEALGGMGRDAFARYEQAFRQDRAAGMMDRVYDIAFARRAARGGEDRSAIKRPALALDAK